MLGQLTGACTRSPPPVRARSIAAQIAEKIPDYVPMRPNRTNEQRRFKDAPVYLDGRRVGVIRPLEPPGQLKPNLRIQPAGLPPAPRFSVADYIAAAGGDLNKIREVHIYGGRSRIVFLSKEELLKHRRDLFFAFTSGTHGKPRVSWPPDGINVNTRVDIISAVAVYQDKPPPVWDPKKDILHFGDGKEIEGIPYAPNEELKGTRFYADGVLVGWMKRKTLPNSILVPGADITSGQFSLAAFIESLGVDPKRVRGIELTQDDDAVAHLDGSALSKGPPLAFTLPRRNQGNLVLWLPLATFPSAPSGTPDPVPIRISAVQLFLKTAPPKRTYVKVEKLVEPVGGEDQRRQDPGSKNDQGETEN